MLNISILTIIVICFISPTFPKNDTVGKFFTPDSTEEPILGNKPDHIYISPYGSEIMLRGPAVARPMGFDQENYRIKLIHFDPSKLYDKGRYLSKRIVFSTNVADSTKWHIVSADNINYFTESETRERPSFFRPSSWTDGMKFFYVLTADIFRLFWRKPDNFGPNYVEQDINTQSRIDIKNCQDYVDFREKDGMGFEILVHGCKRDFSSGRADEDSYYCPEFDNNIHTDLTTPLCQTLAGTGGSNPSQDEKNTYCRTQTKKYKERVKNIICPTEGKKTAKVWSHHRATQSFDDENAEYYDPGGKNYFFEQTDRIESFEIIWHNKDENFYHPFCSKISHLDVDGNKAQWFKHCTLFSSRIWVTSINAGGNFELERVTFDQWSGQHSHRSKIFNVNHKDRFDTVGDYDVWPNYKNITEFFQQHYQIPYYDDDQQNIKMFSQKTDPTVDYAPYCGLLIFKIQPEVNQTGVGFIRNRVRAMITLFPDEYRQPALLLFSTGEVYSNWAAETALFGDSVLVEYDSDWLHYDAVVGQPVQVYAGRWDYETIRNKKSLNNCPDPPKGYGQEFLSKVPAIIMNARQQVNFNYTFYLAWPRELLDRNDYGQVIPHCPTGCIQYQRVIYQQMMKVYCSCIFRPRYATWDLGPREKPKPRYSEHCFVPSFQSESLADQSEAATDRKYDKKKYRPGLNCLSVECLKRINVARRLAIAGIGTACGFIILSIILTFMVCHSRRDGYLLPELIFEISMLIFSGAILIILIDPKFSNNNRYAERQHGFCNFMILGVAATLILSTFTQVFIWSRMLKNYIILKYDTARATFVNLAILISIFVTINAIFHFQFLDNIGMHLSYKKYGYKYSLNHRIRGDSATTFFRTKTYGPF